MSEFRARIIAELDTSKIDKQIKSQIEGKQFKLNNITLDTKELTSKIQQALNGHQFTLNLTNVKVDNLSKTITGQMKNAGNQAGQQFSQSLLSRINNQISTGGLEASISKVTAQYNKLFTAGKGNNQMHAQLLLIKNDLQILNSLQSQISSSKNDKELVSNYEKFEEVLGRVKNNLSSVSAKTKTFASTLQITTLDNKIESWMDKNTRASKNFGTQVQELRNKLAELQASGGATTSQLNSLEQEFNEIKAAATAAGQTGKSFTSTFESGFRSIANYVSISTIIYQTINGLKQMYQNVYNIDTEMTELKKVTDETSETYSKFLKNAASSSKEIGTKISDFVSSTADFARLGYSFDDSQELAKVANVYAVVGDEIDGIDTATKSLISTMTAFKSEIGESISQGEFALSIVDKFNEVGNNFAISSGGIGEALERSASSLSAANNTLDQSIALITAANTVVQDPDSVGSHIKCADLKNGYIG